MLNSLIFPFFGAEGSSFGAEDWDKEDEQDHHQSAQHQARNCQPISHDNGQSEWKFFFLQAADRIGDEDNDDNVQSKHNAIQNHSNKPTEDIQEPVESTERVEHNAPSQTHQPKGETNIHDSGNCTNHTI